MKDLINAITVSEVKQALLQYPESLSHDYLNGKSFQVHVLFRANDLKMSVNEIIADFKKINGVK